MFLGGRKVLCNRFARTGEVLQPAAELGDVAGSWRRWALSDLVVASDFEKQKLRHISVYHLGYSIQVWIYCWKMLVTKPAGFQALGSATQRFVFFSALQIMEHGYVS